MHACIENTNVLIQTHSFVSHSLAPRKQWNTLGKASFIETYRVAYIAIVTTKSEMDR